VLVTGYIFTTLVSVISFILTVKSDFFGLIKDASASTMASLGLAILLFLIGERLTNAQSQRSFNNNLVNEIQKHLSSLPVANTITEFTSADLAMDYLCEKLPTAKIVWNTKISKDAISPRDAFASKYSKALREALKKGLVYKDILSPGFTEYASDIEQFCKNKPGKYLFKVVDVKLNSFINFIVIEHKNGEKELVFGWATSDLNGTESPAYRITDTRIVNYYVDYHKDLSR